MNRFVTRFSLTMLALTLMCGQIRAQFTTTFAKNVNPGQQNGFYYALPETMLQLDFIIQETEFAKGPLSDYADRYLEMTDYVEYETTGYKIVDVKMSTKSTPDPNATFFVTFGNVRGSNKIEFDVMPNGIIRGVGQGNAMKKVESHEVETYEQSQCDKEVQPVTGDRFIGLMSSGKTNAQLAKEVADKIEEIRKAKFNLISGYYETAFNPETFEKMQQQLDEMEKEYLSLFLGKQVEKTIVKTVYVVPNKETVTQTIAKFSETEGLSVGTAGSGSPITVQTLSMNGTEFINAPSQSAIQSMSYENKVFYRVPEMAQVKVSYMDETLIEDRLSINQLGATLMAPIQNTKLVFDTTTGQIVNLKMQ